MANQVRKNGVWERAVADLEKKGYTVETTENGNGTPIFIVTDPSTGKTQESRYPNQVSEWAGTWPKAKPAAAEKEKVAESATHPLRRKSDLYGTVGQENHGDIATAVASIEQKGGIVAQPNWNGGNYEIMGESGEVLTTRRAGDVKAIGNLSGEKPQDEGLKGRIANAFGKAATRRDRDSEWVKNFLGSEPEPAI